MKLKQRLVTLTLIQEREPVAKYSIVEGLSGYQLIVSADDTDGWNYLYFSNEIDLMKHLLGEFDLDHVSI
jgi:hypothetical protein